MPSETSLTSQTKGLFGKIFKKTSSPSGLENTAKPETKVEELERSLTKDDPLLASNTYNGDKEDERKNSKNKRREKQSSGSLDNDEENKENIRSQSDLQNRSEREIQMQNHSVRFANKDPVGRRSTSRSKTSVTSKSKISKSKEGDSSAYDDENSKEPGYQVLWKASFQTLKHLTEEARENEETIGSDEENVSLTRTSIPGGSKTSVFEEDVQSDDASAKSAQKVIESESPSTAVIETPAKQNWGFFGFLKSSFSKKQHQPAQTVSADEPEKKQVEIIETKSTPATETPPAPTTTERKWFGGFKFPGFGRKPKTPVAKPEDEVPKQDEEENEAPDHETRDEEAVPEEKDRVSEHKSDEEEPTTSVKGSVPSAEQPQASTTVDGEEIQPPQPTPRKRTLPTLEPAASEGETRKPIRRRPRKSKAVKKKELEPAVEMAEIDEPGTSEAVEETGKPGEPMTDEDVLAIIVHQTDHLRADLIHMSHPVVRVSVVDGSNGSFLRKSSVSRRVTSYYEHENVTTILPVLTQPYDFRKNKSVLPRWEETIILNESFESMIAQKNVMIRPTSREGEEEPPPLDTGVISPSPILFFVIRDFVSMTKTNNQRLGAKDATERGWHTIAWAFLKLVGSDGNPNTDKKLRLQLYQPVRTAATASLASSETAFFWWRDHPRHKYPSTLYVTVKPVKSPEAAETSLRSMIPLQPEGGLHSYKELRDALAFADKSKFRDADRRPPKWSRLPGQSCKVPNAVCLRLWAASDGAFSIKFSNNGLLLAVACKHGSAYPILFYGIPDGEEMGFLIGHQHLVYDIHWSNDDQKVVTSSGDGTAQVWNLSDKTKPTHTLPHPAYVYTAAFHPSAQHIVATGGYDAVIRVWNIATGTENAQILQELEGHKSFINSLAFDHSHLNLYSVDSSGIIIAWNCHTHEQAKKNCKTSWSLKSKLVDKDLSEVCINSVHVHRGNKKLLLHCRDSVIRMFDVRINTSLNFTGSVNRRQFLRSALTPCGTFAISGSEDGCAYVWNAESSDQVAIYNELGYPRAVRDVTFHPHEHMVAFCCFSPNMPVLVFNYDKNATAFSGDLLSVVGSISGPKVEEVATDGFPTKLKKVDRIKMQLDAALPETGPEVEDPWRVAKKMVPVAMAAKAFSEKKQRHTSSPFTPPLDASIRASPKFPDTRSLYPSQSYASTWGSTFDSTPSIQPSFLSPHASSEARLRAKQIASQQGKAAEEQGVGWKPSFIAVGGSPYRSESPSGPDVSIALDEDGNRILRITASPPDGKRRQYVIALYDYQANRSDELTMVRGDVIKVLYKDGPSWWFGERKEDKKQGYFPTNYVVAQSEEIEEKSPEVLFGVPEVRPVSAESEPSKTVHALKMESGRVKFYSQSESEGEDEPKKAALSLSSRQRRREQRAKAAGISPRQLTKKIDQSTNAPSSEALSTRDLPPVPRTVITQTKSEELLAASKSMEQPKPKARKRVKKSRGKSDVTDDSELSAQKSVSDTFLPEKNSDPLSNLAPDRPHFGVLKAVQAKMAERDSLLSETVVGGADFSKIRPSRLTALDPVLTSTASKNRQAKKSRLKPRSSQRPPTLEDQTVYDNYITDDAIPMVKLKSKQSREGTQNLAYDDVSEV